MDSKIEPVAWDCEVYTAEAGQVVARWQKQLWRGDPRQVLGDTLVRNVKPLYAAPDEAALAAAEQRGRESEWMPIETADKTTMVLACRPDSKTFMCEWMHSDEIEEYPDDAEPHEGWWSGVYGWLEREEAPQFWMPLPLPPAKVVAAAIRKGE